MMKLGTNFSQTTSENFKKCAIGLQLQKNKRKKQLIILLFKRTLTEQCMHENMPIERQLGSIVSTFIYRKEQLKG